MFPSALVFSTASVTAPLHASNKSTPSYFLLSKSRVKVPEPQATSRALVWLRNPLTKQDSSSTAFGWFYYMLAFSLETAYCLGRPLWLGRTTVLPSLQTLLSLCLFMLLAETVCLQASQVTWELRGSGCRSSGFSKEGCLEHTCHIMLLCPVNTLWHF